MVPKEETQVASSAADVPTRWAASRDAPSWPRVITATPCLNSGAVRPRRVCRCRYHEAACRWRAMASPGRGSLSRLVLCRMEPKSRCPV